MEQFLGWEKKERKVGGGKAIDPKVWVKKEVGGGGGGAGKTKILETNKQGWAVG